MYGLNTKEISVEEVKAMLDSRQPFLLLDVREPKEYEVVHIAGAQLVPLRELPKQLPLLAEHMNSLIVTCCHHGARSIMAAQILSQNGFKNVCSMIGGLEAWSLQIDPTVQRY